MSADLRAEQDREWGRLYDLIRGVLGKFGEEDCSEWRGGQLVYTQKDYSLLHENWGNYQHGIETDNLKVLSPASIMSLQKLLAAYPNWEIVISVGGRQKKRPDMGLVIRDDEIIDGCNASNCPRTFRRFSMKEAGRPDRVSVTSCTLDGLCVRDESSGNYLASPYGRLAVPAILVKWGRHIASTPNVILVRWLNEEYARAVWACASSPRNSTL